VLRSLTTGGEEQLKPTATPTTENGPRVIVFAFDGAGSDQLIL